MSWKGMVSGRGSQGLEFQAGNLDLERLEAHFSEPFLKGSQDSRSMQRPSKPKVPDIKSSNLDLGRQAALDPVLWSWGGARV